MALRLTEERWIHIVGEGVVVRYDEITKEVVGLTLVGLRARVLKSLTTEAK